MSEMVRLAVVGDIAEAEEMRDILRSVGIESVIEQSPDDDAVGVLVSDGDLEEATEAIEAVTEPDDLDSEP